MPAAMCYLPTLIVPFPRVPRSSGLSNLDSSISMVGVLATPNNNSAQHNKTDSQNPIAANTESFRLVINRGYQLALFPVR